MIPLDDPRWSQLDHAYGRAADIPALLRALAASPAPAADVMHDPWFTLWSSLCHQEDVYAASYAALPHLVEIAMQAQGPIDFSFFLLPAAIEVSRMEGRGPAMPADLDEAYRIALMRLMDCVARHRHEAWDEATLLSALAAQAAAKGNYRVAKMLLRRCRDDSPDQCGGARARLGEAEAGRASGSLLCIRRPQATSGAPPTHPQ